MTAAPALVAALAAVLAGEPAAESLRAAGEAAEARRDWAGALAAWRACVAEGPDRDARYCASRAAVLAPHEADGFSGWDVLEAVRRDYRALGSDAAIARIERALAEAPDGPAAPAMRLWLANERARRGEHDAVGAIGHEMATDARTRETEARFVAGVAERDAVETRRRAVAGAGALVGAVYVAVAAARRGPWKWRSAGVAAIALGAIPAAFAALYEEGVADGFVRSGLVVTVAVLMAGRAPVWVAVPGTLGGIAAIAWHNGWYPSLGL